MAQDRGHHDQAGLGETVKQPPLLRAEAGDGGDVYYGASRFSLDHFWNDEANETQSGFDVHLHHFIEHFVLHLQGGSLADIRGSIVDQDIHRTKPGLCLSDEIFNLVQFANMARDRNDLAWKPGHLGSGRLQIFHLPAGDHYMGTRPGQSTGNCFSYAPAATGHNGYFSLKRCIHDGLFFQTLLRHEQLHEIGHACGFQLRAPLEQTQNLRECLVIKNG
jgi:hypothetical protein